MKKSLYVFIMFIILSFYLLSCSDSEEKTTTQTEDNPIVIDISNQYDTTDNNTSTTEEDNQQDNNTADNTSEKDNTNNSNSTSNDDNTTTNNDNTTDNTDNTDNASTNEDNSSDNTTTEDDTSDNTSHNTSEFDPTIYTPDNYNVPLTSYKSTNSEQWWEIAQSLWRHFRKTFILPNSSRYKGDNWLVFDYYNTYANSNGAFTSEGVAYGMMLAVLMGDKPIFDSVWTDAEKYLGWAQSNYFFYSWIAYYDRDYEQVVVKQPGVPASDAEIDIAAALIMAYKRWGNTEININSPLYGIQGTITYKERISTLLETIWNKFVTKSIGDSTILDYYINPGGMQQLTTASGYDDDYWVVNPSYFIIANLELFKEFEQNEGLPQHDWDLVIEGCTNIMKRYVSYDKGLQPDWMDFYGRPILKSGKTPVNYKYDMYKDAIRVPWRMATYKLWYDGSYVEEYLTNAVNFVWNNKDGLYYYSDGSYYLDYADNPIFDATGVAMWGTLFMVADSATTEQKTFWEDALQNKLLTDAYGDYYVSGERRYYENALATFAAIMYSGRFAKIYP